MVLDMVIFAIMAYFYVPNDGATLIDDRDQRDFKQQLEGVPNGKSDFANGKKAFANDGFSEEDTKF